jgi:hypothetical protein
MSEKINSVTISEDAADFAYNSMLTYINAVHANRMWTQAQKDERLQKYKPLADEVWNALKALEKH